MPFYDDNTFLVRLFESIDLFLIRWIVNVASGLGVLYLGRTTPIATTRRGADGSIALERLVLGSTIAGATIAGA